MLKFFGAGAIIASVTIGSGETLFASRGGAIFGYSLLWCFVGGALMKGIQVYTATRHITLTGEHPMMHWGHLPGPRNWVPLVIGVLSLLCCPFWLAGLPRMFGEIINWIFGLGSQSPEQFARLARTWGTIAIVVAVTSTWLQTYDVLEWIQRAIVGLLLICVVVSCLAAHPPWLNVLLGTFVPTIPQFEPWVRAEFADIARRPPWVEVAVYLGAIGGGTYDYIGYISCLREKQWGAIGGGWNSVGSRNRCEGTVLPIDTGQDNVHRARRWLLAPQIDTGISILAVLIFTICFAVLGAAILHPQHLVPAGRDLLTHQAQFLTRLHPSLLYLYQVGILLAFWGTIYGAYEIYVRTGYECIRPLSQRLRDAPMASVRRVILVYLGIGGLTLLWSLNDPITIVTPAAIVGGVFTCGLWCFAMIWTDYRFLPSPLRMSKLLLVLTGLSGIVLTSLGVRAVWDYLGS
jgi:Mn2+/Fe2+ NRAMP family transporter